MSSFFKFLAFTVSTICGIIGLFLGLKLIASMWGTFWAVICFFLFPVPLYISPWIAIFRNGDWTLFILSYGGTAAYFLLILISAAFEKNNNNGL